MGITLTIQPDIAKGTTVPQKARIAWIVPSLDRGWRWQALLKEFSAIWPNLVVFTGSWPGFTPGFEETFKIRRLRGFRNLSIGKSDMGYLKRLKWASPLALWDLLRFRPEIILSNGFHLCTIYALLVKGLLHSRVVLLWQGISPETGGGKGSLRLKMRRALGRFFDLAICNTECGTKYLEELVKIPAEKVFHFVGEVAACESFNLNEGLGPLFQNDPRPVFLFVGRIIRSKGVDQLLEACRLLVQRGVTNYTVVLVGKGPHQDEFSKLAHEFGVEQQLHWEGFVPYERLGAYYNACDVFILPSREDTWGVVALEAMAFGKPVLCSRFAGSSELIQNGISGYVFDPGKPQDLANYMMQFIRYPKLIASYGAASRKMMAHYTPRNAAAGLSRMLYNMLGSEPMASHYDEAWRNL